MPDLYVYYRVPAVGAAALLPRVRAMQAALGVPCELKRRPDAKDGLQTWMEVYPATAPGFAERLEAAAALLLDGIEGARHIETFIDCEPCA